MVSLFISYRYSGYSQFVKIDNLVNISYEITKEGGLNMRILLPLFLLYFTASALLSQTTVWRESSFEDFRDGTFGDGGVNTYVSANGRIQTIYRWDANDDGYLDLLFANSHSYSVQLDMSLYYGNGKDFDIRRHKFIPAWGPYWVTPADLNMDGAMDLVVCNQEDGTNHDMDLFVYYGASGKDAKLPGEAVPAIAPFRTRLILANDGANRAAVGDLNGDGHLDIVLAKSGKTRIFWGEDNGSFRSEKFSELEVKNASDVAIADLNGDNWPEVVLAAGNQSVIYWGSQKGLSENRTTKLPTNNAAAVEVADLNRDGMPDILFANQIGDKSFAYLNRHGKFASENRLVFETYRAVDCVTADFNRDGFLDVFFSNHARDGHRIIDSYIYYGSQKGYSNERRMGLRTLGAWGAAVADLNEDGWPDLVVSNYKENDVFEIPSFIYWNSPQGFDVSRRTPLITRGARGVEVADFNGDGHFDVLFVNTKNLFENIYHPNYLYWGNAKGQYSVENRLELWGFMSQWAGMVDLDDDGDVDLIFSNYNEGYLPGETEKWGYHDLFIYWNENNRFDFHRRTILPIYMVHGGLLIADIDRDGYLDIFSGQERVPPQAKKYGIPEGSLIYWGSADGWSVTERTVIPAIGTRMPALADLNKDGHLDLIFGHNSAGGEASIFFTDGTRNVANWRRQFLEGSERTGQLQVADLNKDGWLDIVCTHGKQTDDFFHIYYGDPNARYDIKNRVEIRGVWAKTMNVADVNQDGWLDLLCSNYWHPSRPYGRNGLSHVLLGGPNGFSLDRKISFPTRGGDGTVVSDFNFDGYVDIFWANHREDGDYNQIGCPNKHMTESFIFFGSANGFKQEPDIRLPGRGVHFRKTVDELGHVYNRRFEFDYISSPYNMEDKKPLWIDWQAEKPHRTSVEFQVRVANSREALTKAPWLGPKGEGSYFVQKKSSLRNLPEGKWLQYRAILDTFNGVNSPVLESVEIAFE